MKTKKEDIELLATYLKTLQRGTEAFWHLIDEDLIVVEEPDPETEIIARLADKYGFDGEIFRCTVPPIDDDPLSIEAYSRLKEKIKTLPKIIAAIEQYSEPVTIPQNAELLSVPQVAEILGWGGSTVRERNDKGLLPMPIKIGGSVQWAKRELYQWLEAKCPPRQRWDLLRQRKGA